MCLRAKTWSIRSLHPSDRHLKNFACSQWIIHSVSLFISFRTPYLIELYAKVTGRLPKITDFENWIHLRLLHCDIPFRSYSDLDFPLDLLSSIRSGSLDKLSIVVKIEPLSWSRRDQLSPEIILNCNWSLFCSQVSRIMDRTGSKFEFQLSYRFVAESSREEIAQYEARLQSRCQSTLSILGRREHFQALANTPNITCKMTETRVIVLSVYSPSLLSS